MKKLPSWNTVNEHFYGLREAPFATGQARYTTEQEDVKVLEKTIKTGDRPVFPSLPITESGCAGGVVGLARGRFVFTTEGHTRTVARQLRGQCGQLHLPAGRERQVPGPVGPGQRQRNRRQAARDRRRARMQQTIEALGRGLVVHRGSVRARRERALDPGQAEPTAAPSAQP